jgi:hypothetical protein
MKRFLHLMAIAAFLTVGMTSCTRDGDFNFYVMRGLQLEVKQEGFKNFIVGNKFLPVEFYADKPIDYIETNTAVLAETDLSKYIIGYIKDDAIPFAQNHSLPVTQNALKMPGNDSLVLDRTWNISISKEKDELYVTYLDYFYAPLKYTVVEFQDDYFLAYVDWTSKVDPTKTARLYTKFKKQ